MTGPVMINRAARRRFSAVGFIMLMIVAVMLAVGAILRYLIIRFDLGDHAYLMSVLNLVPIYLTGVPLAVFFFGMMDSIKLPEHRIPFPKLIEIFVMCIPLMIGGSLIGNVLSDYFSDGQATSPVTDLLSRLNSIDAVSVVLIGPIAEEILCRKMIIDHTVRYGEKTALVLSALCFALLHRNFFQFFYAFGLGLIFGYIYLRSGRLRYSIGYHITFNFMGGIIAPAIIKLMDYDRLMETMRGGDVAAANAIIAKNSVGVAIASAYSMAMFVGVLAGIAFLILRWKEIRFYRLPEELQRGTVIRTAYLNVGMILFMGACTVLMVMGLYS